MSSADGPISISLEDLLKAIGGEVDEVVFGGFRKERHCDVERVAYLIVAYESARYFIDKMPLARACRTRTELFQLVLAAAKIDGLTLEFGVFTGDSLKLIAAGTSGPVYGFDAFRGLPEDWTHFQRKGRFDRGGQAPEGLPANAEVVTGWFEDTLGAFLSSHPGPIRFAHIDCDLYSSTKTVLEQLAPRLVPGTILLFDEYFNYPNWQQGEFKAFQELVAERGVRYEYLGFRSRKCAVAVRISEIRST